MRMSPRLFIFLFIFFTPASLITVAAAELVMQPAQAQLPMINEHLHALIRRLDEKAEGRTGIWQFMVEDREVMVITDKKVNRMRIIVPIERLDKLSEAQMRWMLQANFDSVLDARYAIAKEVLWSAYLHPLSSLRDRQFLEGAGQVVNLAATFGSSYTSGALIFRGGDSEGIERRKLIDKLIEKGMAT